MKQCTIAIDDQTYDRLLAARGRMNLSGERISLKQLASRAINTYLDAKEKRDGRNDAN